MKKIIFTLTLLIVSIVSFSQSNDYNQAKQLALDNGYTIAEEKVADIAQGAFLYNYRTFYQGTSYVIFATSDDSDVKDVDIYLSYMDGDIRNKDNDYSNIAVISFTPGATLNLKISVYNFSSNTPLYESRCRYFIAYK